ncbi:MAG: BatA domain-containing protein [Flavobacteriales bacterium]|nr:BatA domain-containing protein [Flavobacteriales bacterium]
MAFLFPSFLWALTALAVPVIIHLFQLRRFKRIAFSNVRMLQEVSQRTRSRKQVKHWLVLLMRLLALACLVMAFAQPYLPDASGAVKAGQRAVSLFVDDSWSMDGTAPQGRLLDQARKNAQDAVLAYKPTDRFQVLTNTFEGRQQVLLGRDEALEAAAKAEVGPYSRPLSQVLLRQREALARADAPVKQALLFTDLQRASVDVENWTNDSLVPTTIVPLQPNTADNLAIDSVWFASPVRRVGQTEALHVRIRNFGTRALENVPLTLTIDGRQRALATFAIGPEATVDTVMRFTNDAEGQHGGELALTDRPVTFDDHFFIAYRTIDRSRVLLISGGDAESDRNIAAVFGGDSAQSFLTQPYRQVDLASFASTDLIVLNGLPDVPSGTASALQEFVADGGSLAVFPGKEGDVNGLSALFAPYRASLGKRDTASMKVDRIDLQQPFYREVFTTMPKNVELPIARLRYTLSMPPAADALLRLQSGDPFLVSIPAGKGQVYIGASPLTAEGGTFTQHALFVTSLLRMAELSRPMGALYHTIGAEANIPVEGVDLSGETAPHLKGPAGADLVPEVRRSLTSTTIALHDEQLDPGVYALTLNDDTVATIALNLVRTESDLGVFTPEQLQQRLEELGLNTFSVVDATEQDLSVRLSKMDQGTKLWKWFVIGALLFLALEILIIRLTR